MEMFEFLHILHWFGHSKKSHRDIYEYFFVNLGPVQRRCVVLVLVQNVQFDIILGNRINNMEGSYHMGSYLYIYFDNIQMKTFLIILFF